MCISKILIVGSGCTDEVSGEWDKIYCANSAISRVPERYDHKIVHVASMNLFSPFQDKNSVGRSDYLWERSCTIIGRRPAKLVIQGNPEDIKKLSSIDVFGYCPGEFIAWDRRTFYLNCLQIFGFKTVLATWFRRNEKIKDIRRFFVAFFLNRRLLHNLKPSTGVLAIGLAIRENGRAAEYYVSGISMNRNETFYNGIRIIISQGDGHMPFDYYALKRFSNMIQDWESGFR